MLDVIGAEEWIRKHVEPIGAIEATHARPWATVMRVPVVGGVIWFKACAQVQAFEPRLALPAGYEPSRSSCGGRSLRHATRTARSPAQAIDASRHS